MLSEIQRLKEILLVFHKHGFTNYIREIGLHSHLPLHKRTATKNRVGAAHLRLAFEELGPTFIKLGQVLSLRPDILPKEFIRELELMQDHVPEFSFQQAKHIIESELNKTLKELFKKFSSQPIASASVSQVYQGTLHNGEIVAVKVQRPNVRACMDLDIQLMLKIASLVELHLFWLKKYRVRSIIEEFQSWTADELDLSFEAESIDMFHQFKFKNFTIPKVYHQFSTKKVLTMQFLRGIEFHNIKQVRKRHHNIQIIIEKTYADIVTQVFENGLFHADPHPGNLLVMSNGRVALLDFGIVGEFDGKLQKRATELFLGIIQNNSPLVTKVLRVFGANKSIEKSSAQKTLRRIIRPLQRSSIDDVHVSDILHKVLQFATNYGVKWPRDFVLFAKTIMTLEGLALRYNPKFKIVSKTKPLLQKLVRKHFSPSAKLHSMYTMISDFVDDVPEVGYDILNRLRSGEVSVTIDGSEVKEIATEFEHSSANIAMGAVIAALILGSAIILENNINIIVPLVGIGIASILGLWLIHRTIHIEKKRGIS